MLVYRVENNSGDGMYSNEGFYISIPFTNSEHHSPPHRDSKLMREMCKKEIPSIPGFHFGFSSLDQLKSWIYLDEWRVKLDNDGYDIHIYEINNEEDYAVGDTQMIFKKKNATKTKVTRITEI